MTGEIYHHKDLHALLLLSVIIYQISPCYKGVKSYRAILLQLPFFPAIMRFLQKYFLKTMQRETGKILGIYWAKYTKM